MRRTRAQNAIISCPLIRQQADHRYKQDTRPHIQSPSPDPILLIQLRLLWKTSHAEQHDRSPADTKSRFSLFQKHFLRLSSLFSSLFLPFFLRPRLTPHNFLSSSITLKVNNCKSWTRFIFASDRDVFALYLSRAQALIKDPKDPQLIPLALTSCSCVQMHQSTPCPHLMSLSFRIGPAA